MHQYRHVGGVGEAVNRREEGQGALVAGRILGGKGRGRDGKMHSFCPILLYGQVPLPGEVVMLVVISEEGLVVVCAPGQHALGSLLSRGEEFVFLWPRPIAANHKCCFIH